MYEGVPMHIYVDLGKWSPNLYSYGHPVSPKLGGPHILITLVSVAVSVKRSGPLANLQHMVLSFTTEWASICLTTSPEMEIGTMQLSIVTLRVNQICYNGRVWIVLAKTTSSESFPS